MIKDIFYEKIIRIMNNTTQFNIVDNLTDYK